ncbi:MAG TPA: alpha/beta hydrolase [Streptosporangiaceae bacterium]|jgi:hypothetical protein
MVTFAQLRDAKLEPLSDAVTAWTKLVKKLESAEDDYRGKLLKPLRDSKWQGKTATVAVQTLVPFTQYFRVSATEASSIASVLDTGHRQFTAAQNKLKRAVDGANGLHVSVGDDGSIQLPQTSDANEQKRLKAQAGIIQGQLAQAVKEATEADNRIAQALGKLGPEILDRPNSALNAADDAKMAAGLAGFDKNNIPPKGVDTPKEAADWWRSLPEEQRHLMMNAFPEQIGWLNGIPSEDRDEANRVSLAHRIAQLEEQKGVLNGPERTELGQLKKLQAQLGALDSHGRDAYLLGIDSRSHDGRAVVAVGNPDHAKHTGVLVPGWGNNLDGFGTTLDRANRLQDLSSQYADGNVSTIAWLGYDPPLNAEEWAAGQQGAPALNATVDGLRQAQADAGTNSQVTVIGHSYGSTLVGEAAKNGGLHANDIVVAGSPGTHVSHASDLHVGANHVWSEVGSSDPIPAVGKAAHGGMPEPSGHYDPSVSNVLPSDPRFGGNRMQTDTGGHTEYWTPNSESMKNQARVIAGRYNDVTHARG